MVEHHRQSAATGRDVVPGERLGDNDLGPLGTEHHIRGGWRPSVLRRGVEVKPRHGRIRVAEVTDIRHPLRSLLVGWLAKGHQQRVKMATEACLHPRSQRRSQRGILDRPVDIESKAGRDIGGHHVVHVSRAGRRGRSCRVRELTKIRRYLRHGIAAHCRGVPRIGGDHQPAAFRLVVEKGGQPRRKRAGICVERPQNALQFSNRKGIVRGIGSLTRRPRQLRHPRRIGVESHFVWALHRIADRVVRRVVDELRDATCRG